MYVSSEKHKYLTSFDDMLRGTLDYYMGRWEVYEENLEMPFLWQGLLVIEKMF